MRVLSIQHYPTFGGPSNEIVLLEPHLNQQGIETIVAITEEPGSAVPGLTGHVELVPIPLGRMRQVRSPIVHLGFVRTLPGDIRILRGLIKRYDIDLVKVHGPHNFQGGVAAALSSTAITWVISSSRVPPAFRRAGVQIVRRLADSVLVNGRTLLDLYPGGYRLADRAFPYYPPVDCDRFSPANAKAKVESRRAIGIVDETTVVGTVANVNPQKGLELFIAMAAQIRSLRRDTTFVVAGAIEEAHRGYYEALLEKARRASIPAERLLFLGARSDVDRVLQAFDVKVITSVPNSEGTTTTGLEAMACGVPVVATDVGAVHEVVLDGTTGFLVPFGDPEQLAGTIGRLLDDQDLREKMGLAARNHAEKSFTPRACARVHAEAYEFALQRHQAAIADEPIG